MKKYLALGAALLAMSACNNSGTGGNESKAGENATGNAAAAEGGEANGAAGATGNGSGGSSGSAAASGNDTLEPGLYETSMRMNMTAPGLPPGAGQQQQSRRQCITPEESREMANTFGEVPEGMQCSERRFTMRGGTIDGQMSCRGQGGDFTVRMTGTYTSTSFNLRQEMNGRMPGAQQPMNMQMQIEGRRVAAQCSDEDERRERPGNGGGEG